MQVGLLRILSYMPRLCRMSCKPLCSHVQHASVDPQPSNSERSKNCFCFVLFCFLFLRKQTVGVPDTQSYIKNVTKTQVLGLTSHHPQKRGTVRRPYASFSLWAPLSCRLLFRGNCSSNVIVILEKFFHLSFIDRRVCVWQGCILHS